MVHVFRLQTVTLLRSVSSSGAVGDADILKWANATLASAGRSSTFSSFKVGATLMTLAHDQAAVVSS
jgi:hypothetical protein